MELSDKSFRKQQLCKCKLQEHIRNCLRLEYFWQLREQMKKIRNTPEFKVEVVIVEVPNQNKLNWPLREILNIFPRKDGTVQLTSQNKKQGNVEAHVRFVCP